VKKVIGVVNTDVKKKLDKVRNNNWNKLKTKTTNRRSLIVQVVRIRLTVVTRRV
jgi:hypothetical protein